MKREIEIFEFLKAKSTIKKIDINDLYILLTKAYKGKTYKNYTIKMMNNVAILIHDSNNNSNILLSCIKDICPKLPKNCAMIRSELNVPQQQVDLNGNERIDCSLCYLKYIEKLKNGEF